MSLSIHSYPIFPTSWSNTLKAWRSSLAAMRLRTHLRDVSITTPADGNLLRYDGSDQLWKNIKGPIRSTFTPVFSAGGSMSFGTAPTVSLAELIKWEQLGIALFAIEADGGGLTGSAHNDVYVTLGNLEFTEQGGGACGITDSDGTYLPGSWFATSGGSSLTVQKSTSANWAVSGTGFRLDIQGIVFLP